jgi:hypothetical protein
LITVIHTPVFLEETISNYASDRSTNAPWRGHLSFAVDICNGGYFLSKGDIWHSELVEGRGQFAVHVLPERETRRYRSRSDLIRNLRAVAETGDLAAEWDASALEREDTHRKKQAQRETFRTMRNEVSAAIRERRLTGALSAYSFAQFRQATFLQTGRVLMGIVDERRRGQLAELWSAHPHRYPYYSAFVEGMVYAAYYATAEHAAPLDTNAQADYEQLAYLVWADVIVSDDTRFMRHAFQAVWKPRGKKLLTAAEFARLAHALAGC